MWSKAIKSMQSWTSCAGKRQTCWSLDFISVISILRVYGAPYTSWRRRPRAAFLGCIERDQRRKSNHRGIVRTATRMES